MPMSSNGGGPWGGGGDSNGGSPWGGDGGKRGSGGGGGGGGGGQRPPDIDDILKEGRERLKVIIGGGGGRRRGGGSGGGGQGLGKGGIALIVFAALAFYVWNAVYTVKPEERSVILTFGERSGVGEPGLNFILWPVQSAEIIQVTRENTIDIGVNSGRSSRAGDQGLMLTGDENIVDIDFQVVWNVLNPEDFLFNLAAPEETIRAVSESAMREVIGRSELSPILNRDRGIISQEVETLIQTTLDSYESGVNIVRVNFDKADPPQEVIDSFREVQAAEQERDTFEKQADAYANQKLAGARGEAAQMLQDAEGYRAQVVNEAQGEASRFKAVYGEYAKASEVTRKRLYLETMERVLGDVEKIIIDENGGEGGGQGVVPYLPLNELRRGRTN